MVRYRISFLIIIACAIINNYVMHEVAKSTFLGPLHLIPFQAVAVIFGFLSILYVLVNGWENIFKSNEKWKVSRWKCLDLAIFIGTWIVLIYSVFITIALGK